MSPIPPPIRHFMVLPSSVLISSIMDTVTRKGDSLRLRRIWRHFSQIPPTWGNIRWNGFTILPPPLHRPTGLLFISAAVRPEMPGIRYRLISKNLGLPGMVTPPTYRLPSTADVSCLRTGIMGLLPPGETPPIQPVMSARCPMASGGRWSGPLTVVPDFLIKRPPRHPPAPFLSARPGSGTLPAERSG